MLHPSIWYGSVVQATSTSIVIGNSLGDMTIYGGSFFYNSSQISGTLNNITDYNHGALSFIVSNLNALTVFNLLQSGNATTAEQWALAAGGNTITGSGYSDYLIGFGGTNTFIGSAGNDIIRYN
ncbi:MAG: hypothetical protein WCL60_10320 [Methylococcales bacterium]